MADCLRSNISSPSSNLQFEIAVEGLQMRQALHLRWVRQQGATAPRCCAPLARPSFALFQELLRKAWNAQQHAACKGTAGHERARAHSEPTPCWCPSAWHSWRRMSSTSACREGIRPHLHLTANGAAQPLLDCSPILHALQVAQSIQACYVQMCQAHTCNTLALLGGMGSCRQGAGSIRMT